MTLKGLSLAFIHRISVVYFAKKIVSEGNFPTILIITSRLEPLCIAMGTCIKH